MKYFYLNLILLIMTFQACATPNDTLKIGVVSDIHYLAKDLMDSGEAVKAYAASTGREITQAPLLLDHVLNEMERQQVDVLLIPGDLTKDGEKKSHLELVNKFKLLKEKGIRIYVIPGNHDINMPYAKGYKENTSYETENINPLEFEQIYNDFGYSEAIYRDENSLSYVVELSNNSWLVCIDVSRYKEYTNHSISGGKISKETEKWLQKIFNSAKEQNKMLIGMMHHSLVEHLPYHAMMFPQYIVENWNYYAGWFADNNMQVVFTGHFHANDITKYTSPNKHSIYDVETGAMISYAFPYRIIDMDKSAMDIKSYNLFSLLSPDVIEQNKKNLKRIAYHQALSKIKSFGLEIDPAVADKIADIAGDILLLHVAGDEVMTDNLKNQLKQLGSLLDQDAENIDFQLDFYPPDNNVRIEFE